MPARSLPAEHPSSGEGTADSDGEGTTSTEGERTTSAGVDRRRARYRGHVCGGVRYPPRLPTTLPGPTPRDDSGVNTVPPPRPIQLPPSPVPLIPEPETLLHRERASGAAWHLAGRRAQLRLSGLGGVEGIDLDGRSVTGRVALADLTGANLSLAPRGYRRECFAGPASVMERVVVPEMLPGVVIQWDFSSAATRPGLVTLQATLLPGHGPAEDASENADGEVAVHTDPGLIWMARGDLGVLLMAPHLAAAGTDAGELPEPSLIEGAEAVLLEWALPVPEDGLITVLLQFAPREGRWTSPRALAGVEAHHIRGEAAAIGRDEPGIRPGTGVEEMDEGITWARTWLRHRLLTRPRSARSVHPLPAPTYLPSLAGEPLPDTEWETPASIWNTPGSEAAWTAMAAAAAGEWEAAEGALDALAWGTPAERLSGFMALAAFMLWTGDAGPLKARVPQLMALARDSSWYGEIPPTAFAGIRDALASAAEAAELSELHEAVKAMPLPVPASSGGSGRRLPMAGGSAAGSPAVDVLPSLLRLGRHGITPAARLREANLLRTLLGEIASEPSRVGDGSAARAIMHLVGGLLGAVPDATFGRLDLSPLFPGHWTGFRLSGVRAGEGTLALSYQRTDDTARWEITPELGSVPITVNFEPWFPFPSVSRCLVDGNEAELESVSVDGWTRVKVQVPADGVRTLVVEAGPA